MHSCRHQALSSGFLLSQPDLLHDGDDLSEYLHFWIRIVSAVLSGTGLHDNILSEELKETQR
jgi:hypothetical protein